MIVSILGCGWYGKSLAKSLADKGILVKGSTTDIEKTGQIAATGATPYVVNFEADHENSDSDFFVCDVLVVSIPPKFKKNEAAEYILKLERIVSISISAGIKKVIYISSTGVYGDHNETVDEHTKPHPDKENGEILLKAEQIFSAQKNFKTTILRFGGLIGPDRHPGRFFAGKTGVPNGKAPVNLIHLDDCVAITSLIIEKNAFGYLFNACAPIHPEKAEFYREAALHANLPLPDFLDELDRWKIVNSANLQELLNYQFIANSQASLLNGC